MTGAPGSGKSTLGSELASHLRLPFLARDDVRGGLLHTNGAWTGRLERIPSGDETVTASGDCVVITTTCNDPMRRVRERTLSDRLLSNPAVMEAVDASSIDEHTEAIVARRRTVTDEMRSEFAVPVLAADTDGGWSPSLDAIVQFVTAPPP